MYCASVQRDLHFDSDTHFLLILNYAKRTPSHFSIPIAMARDKQFFTSQIRITIRIRICLRLNRLSDDVLGIDRLQPLIQSNDKILLHIIKENPYSRNRIGCLFKAQEFLCMVKTRTEILLPGLYTL